MKSVITVLAISLSGLLSACSSPPKVKDCAGEFRPVNNASQNAVADRASIQSLCTQA